MPRRQAAKPRLANTKVIPGARDPDNGGITAKTNISPTYWDKPLSVDAGKPLSRTAPATLG